MVKLVDVNANMLPEIYDGFLRDSAIDLTRQNWESLLAPCWSDPDSPCGFALRDNGRFVGFLGMMTSERQVAGQPHEFCNLHSWIVDEAYRGHSLTMMRPVLRQRHRTLTDLTPSRSVYRVGQRLGLQPLDTELTFLFPFGRRRLRHRRELTVVDEQERLSELLGCVDRRILDDHQGFPCRHAAFHDGYGYCYVVYTVVQTHWLSYCYVHYLSNSRMFERYQSQIRRWLIRHSGCRLLAMDSRMVGEAVLPNSRQFPIRSLKLFRSAELQPRQIDNLYSELVACEFSGLPNFTRAAKRRLHGLVRKLSPNKNTRSLQLACRETQS